LLLKSIVVVYKGSHAIYPNHFKATEGHFRVSNNTDGVLVVQLVDKEQNRTIAVYNKDSWVYWREDLPEIT